MASTTPGGLRGRRKQAKPQRKVEHETSSLESRIQYNTILTEVAATASSMSPDTNHTQLSESQVNGVHKEAAVPEEVLGDLTFNRLLKTGEDEEKLEEYLQRSDTAVIYPEAVAHLEMGCEKDDGASPESNNGIVPSLSNGLIKEHEEVSNGSEYFIKCPQCQKGYQTFQALKEHMETFHVDVENGTVPVPSEPSPSPSLVSSGGPFGCSQCTSTFANKDQLEKHELLHSPNAQVSCKICNKTFANVYRLQRHMISHDESAILRKFKCTECDKAFKFKHHLKEHIRIHSGEKPFECGNCGKRFSHSGSYSSHMTSKKCLVMNLKLGRTRTPTTNSLLDKNSQTVSNIKRPRMGSLNNNITTSPNHNAYLPILPKFTEAAAAFLQSSLANNSGMSPFYIPTPGILNTGHTLNPYSLSHLLEQFQGASPLRPAVLDNCVEESKSQEDTLQSPSMHETEDLPKSNSSSCGDLVMDEEAENRVAEKDDHDLNGDSRDFVKRILETVNSNVTKELLQVNMHKFSSETSSDCHSIASAHSPKNDHFCTICKLSFTNQTTLEEHDCDRTAVRSEGLAAKLEDAVTTKSEDINSAEEDQEYDRMNKTEDYEVDCESVTTTDHVSEDGRKVRVRSLISDEQLKVLKDNYSVNPRPKREELIKIASTIGFPVRVVQVWFQNTRARDRREGRMIQVPYSPASTLPIRFPPNSVHAQKHLPVHSTVDQYASEQPLDLSTKKSPLSSQSSPSNSPQRPSSVNHQSDSGEEVVNLSHKSSRSPTPYHLNYQNHYQNSNCSSEPQRSPSPAEFNCNTSRLAQILAQPAHKLALPGMGLVPMMQFGADLPSLSQLINNRMSSLSPSSEKKWHETNDSNEDDGKHRKMVPQFVLKGLGSPVLGQSEEPEGQFTCDQCDKAFSKQSSLARHKYEHSGQRPHKCNECPKAFKHKHHLTEHKRLHSGEKPFQCCKCLKRFSHSGSYSQHMNHRYSYCKPYRE